MNGNTELLNFVYQNSQMGIETIPVLLDISEDEQFKKQLQAQLSEYNRFHDQVREMLHECGHDEKGLSTFEKIKTYFMLNLDTLTDRSTSHLAEMMIVGSTMGVIDALRKTKEYRLVNAEVLGVMEKLRLFEEENIQKLKAFI